MTTRQTAGDDRGVPSGFNSGAPTDEEIVIPPCSIEDVDEALFRMFDSEIGFQVRANEGDAQKVRVVFAAGERFALVKRRKALRDRNGVLILPLIAIRRTSVSQTDLDITSRGQNQFTGDIVIRRRLAPEDRSYQLLVNKLGLREQDSIAAGPEVEVTGTLKTRTDRNTGASSRTRTSIDGALLAPALGDNVFEFITIPEPQFYTAEYEITISVQYTQHLNQITERLLSSYLPQGRTLRLESPKGYWFVARFGETIAPEDNFEDFSEKERVIMATIKCEVPAYVIHGTMRGSEPAARRHFSAPRVSFDVRATSKVPRESPLDRVDDPSTEFLLTDYAAGVPTAADDRARGIPYAETIENPFTGKKEKRHLQLTSQDPDIGESVFKSV